MFPKWFLINDVSSNDNSSCKSKVEGDMVGACVISNKKNDVGEFKYDMLGSWRGKVEERFWGWGEKFDP